MNWTQPVCLDCWTERNPERQPVRVKDASTEECCYCGTANQDGIYVRVDPRTVPYPKEGE